MVLIGGSLVADLTAEATEAAQAGAREQGVVVGGLGERIWVKVSSISICLSRALSRGVFFSTTISNSFGKSRPALFQCGVS